MPDDRVDREELLYRRRSLRRNPPAIDPNDLTVLQAAFIPGRHDVDGISLIRAKYRTTEEVACPPDAAHRDYVVAEVPAKDLINLGLTLDVTPDALDRERGTFAHVSVREMNTTRYRDSDVLAWARRIAEHHVTAVVGPFKQGS